MHIKSTILASTILLAACGNYQRAEISAPAPVQQAKASDLSVEEMLNTMTLEQKIAQLIMPDISTITPADVEKYRFGSILNGGNSGPGGDDQALAPEWLALADAVWDASTKPLSNGAPVIPTLWATDAVHGHSNVPGATIFPHNIALGATRDAELMRRIGTATAAEIAVTGIDWTFAPTLAVATDDRWGRTYESFAENPDLVSSLGTPTILGLQGDPESDSYLDQTRVIATAKHFFGDGGTAGKDRGDTKGSDEYLRSTHLAPYTPAIAAGVQTVMASFSSVNGVKVHGSKDILTSTLRDELGFEGLVVGDWNGHGELAGCTNTDCPEALMAGLDIYMVPEDWKGLYETLLAQAQDGTIPMARVDEAVSRILKVKEEYGLFDKPKPSDRVLAGKFDQIGSIEHREIAREAVRKSLVLLKNNGVLPLKSSANVVVAGRSANSIPMQSGGWSITWQGGGALTNADFPGATTVFAGLAKAMANGGGSAELVNANSSSAATAEPDAAIVVFGEAPYAEFVGDLADLAFRDEEGLELLRSYKAQKIPTVALFLSGRPLWMNRELDAADAFVAGWLPGTEGGGIADVLVGDAAGVPQHDFAGKLAFDWPAKCAPTGPSLLPFGAGGTYSQPPEPLALDLDCALLVQDFSAGLEIFDRGLSQTVKASAVYASGTSPLINLVGSTDDGTLVVTAFDRDAQEDARRLTWTAPASLGFGWTGGAAEPSGTLVMRVRVNDRPSGRIALAPVCEGCENSVDLTGSLDLAAGKGWRDVRVPLRCLADRGLTGFSIKSDRAFVFELDLIGIVPQATSEDCTGPF